MTDPRTAAALDAWSMRLLSRIPKGCVALTVALTDDCTCDICSKADQGAPQRLTDGQWVKAPGGIRVWQEAS